jgi:pentatricopeptide repeat protein
MLYHMLGPGPSSGQTFDTGTIRTAHQQLSAANQLQQPALVAVQQPPGSQTSTSTIEGLKHAISAARAGTGVISELVRTAACRPREAAFTSLLKLQGTPSTFTPSTFTHSTVSETRIVADSSLLAAASTKEWRKAVEIFEAGLTLDYIKHNCFTYTALISTLCTCDQVLLAVSYYRKMLRVAATNPNCTPNQRTRSCLVAGEEAEQMC